nr:hypothetical protein CFP56_71097 [Quercus suber]
MCGKMKHLDLRNERKSTNRQKEYMPNSRLCCARSLQPAARGSSIHVSGMRGLRSFEPGSAASFASRIQVLPRAHVELPYSDAELRPID